MNRLKALLALVTVTGLLGCAAGPEPIRWGTDTCELCRMVLSDKAFGAEFVAARGQAKKFDEVGEMAAWMAKNPGDGQVYVVDAANGELIPAETAVYLSSPDLIGPMGGNVASFSDRTAAEAFAAERKLTQLTWPGYEQVMADGRAEADQGGLHGSH